MSEKGDSLARSMAVTILVTLLFQPRIVYAYVDPNAGGWLFQMLMPAFTAAMGLWLFLRRWIAERIRTFWCQLTGRQRER
jgi:hypothetical protein